MSEYNRGFRATQKKVPFQAKVPSKKSVKLRKQNHKVTSIKSERYENKAINLFKVSQKTKGGTRTAGTRLRIKDEIRASSQVKYSYINLKF